MAVIEQDYTGFALDPATGKRHTLRHLPEDGSDWETQVYMLEEGDKVLAGIQGVVNLPLQQLTNRTAYLKAELAKRGAVTKLITLETSGWQNANPDGTGTESLGSYVYVYADDDIAASMIPMAVITPQSINTAQSANINDTVQTLEGKLLIWADQVPSADITVQLSLFATANYITAGDIQDGSETLSQDDIGDVLSGMYPDD